MNDILVTIVIPVWNQETLVLRALDSIPSRDDIEVIVIDDGSTDGTWQNLLHYRDTTDLTNLVLLYNKENLGVAYTVNKGYDNARGKYIVNLGSDDYFYTDTFTKCLDILKDNDYDLVYFNLKTNNGEIMRLSANNREILCGSVKFMRREFLGDSRCPIGKQVAEDYALMQQLIAKNPTEYYTDEVIKHYNFPREGSLINLANRGIL